MLNFAVDPKIVAPHVPTGTQLDFHNDETYLSVVGFLFYHAKISARSTVIDRVGSSKNLTPIQPDEK